MDCSTPGFPDLHYLPEFEQTHVHWVGDAIQPSHLLLSPSPPALNLSQHQGLWPKYWSFSFNSSPSNEYSGLISFRIDWFDLLAVQETLKSALQHCSLKVSIFWFSAFFMVQFSIFLVFIYAVLNKSFNFSMTNLSKSLMILTYEFRSFQNCIKWCTNSY